MKSTTFRTMPFLATYGTRGASIQCEYVVCVIQNNGRVKSRRIANKDTW
jgi:hypothetical protein